MSDVEIAIEKIKKLLRLGRRTNHAAEAASALMKAQELAAKHGLKVEEINDADVTQRIAQERGETKRASLERQRVWELLFDYFGVKVLFHSRLGNLYVGPEINIAIARHIEVFLLREVSQAWSVRKRELEEELSWTYSYARRKQIRKEKPAFIIGFFHAIDEKLKLNPLRNDRENDALKGAITHYMKTVIKPGVKKHTKTDPLDEDAFWSGAEVGERVNLSRPMEGAAQRAALKGGAARQISG